MPDRTITKVATCPACGIFCGLITSDGRGPLFTGCHASFVSYCPMHKILEPFQERAERELRQLGVALAREAK